MCDNKSPSSTVYKEYAVKSTSWKKFNAMEVKRLFKFKKKSFMEQGAGSSTRLNFQRIAEKFS